MRRVQSKQKNAPDLSDVLGNLKDSILKDINCIKVGVIKSFNATRQTVSAQVSIKQVVDVDDKGAIRYQTIPIMVECPFVFMTGGDARITIPPQAEDGCLLLFNDRDIDNWFIEGGIKAPNTSRKHDLSDAFAIVGVKNLQTAIGDFLTDGIQLQYTDADKIDIKAGTIESLTALFKQTGNMQVTGGLAIGGTVTQLGGTPLVVDADVTQASGKVLKAGNGWSGTFLDHASRTVTVADGIITGVV